MKNNNDSKNVVNINVIPDKNDMPKNNQVQNIFSNPNNILNNNQENIKSKNVQEIFLSSKKSQKKVLQIKLSSSKKTNSPKI